MKECACGCGILKPKILSRSRLSSPYIRGHALDHSGKGKARFGDRNPAWKGGKWSHGRDTYWMIYDPDRKKYIAEQRLNAEKALGRRLNSKEIVHHINGDRQDNRNSNLLICSPHYHKWLHNRMSYLYQQEHFGSSRPDQR